MVILAFLQNQWFKDPEAIKAMFDEHPERRQRYIAAFLFMGCKTGKILQQALGEELCEQIIWEEVSTHIGSKSNSVFPADHSHIRSIVNRFNPDIILCFGSIANAALCYLHSEFPNNPKLLFACHPAARGSISSVFELAANLKEIINVRSNVTSSITVTT